MNPDYEKQLEACVHHELQALGELDAPPALAGRVMRSIAERNSVPWYRRAWPTWSLELRLASLTVLLIAFVGLCFGTWELSRAAATLEATSSWFADAQALWRTAGVLGGVVHSFTKELGTGVAVTGLVVLFAAAAMCLGLGSACVQLALRPALNRDSP